MKPIAPIPASVALAVLVGALPAAPQPDATELPLPKLVSPVNVSVIADGGFEDPDSKAWRFSDWPPRPETSDRLIADSVAYSQEVAHAGQGSLRIDLTTVEEDRNLLAQQKFGADVLAPHEGRRVRMSAWIRLEGGPPGTQGTLSIRQWGPPGAPPISHASLRLPAVQGEWTEASTEFTLRVGETTRGDITVGMRQVADLATSPVVYVDDVTLEVVAEPQFTAALLRGRTVSEPDRVVAVSVALSAEAWQAGLRHLTWNVTSPDGLRAYNEGKGELTSGRTVVEVEMPRLPEGNYAVRVALGAGPGARQFEALLPFRKAEGPFGR